MMDPNGHSDAKTSTKIGKNMDPNNRFEWIDHVYRLLFYSSMEFTSWKENAPQNLGSTRITLSARSETNMVCVQ